jgi:hypothetical protein
MLSDFEYTPPDRITRAELDVILAKAKELKYTVGDVGHAAAVFNPSCIFNAIKIDNDEFVILKRDKTKI